MTEATTSLITVDDKASPKLREMVELSQRLNRVANDALNDATTERVDVLTDEEAAIAVVALSEALSDVSDALAAIGVLSTHLSTYFATVAQAAQHSKE